jgi:glyoxylase-like metal-dependent hydrolase (beta-lactamase superfamily II)
MVRTRDPPQHEDLMTTDRLYFRQLLAGRDFARQAPGAAEMRNFVYLIGDRETSECVVVDPAWGVKDLVDLVGRDGMKLVGALATHHHPDHVGGDLMGMCDVEGVPELLRACPVPVHCHRAEAPWIQRSLGLEASDLSLRDSGDVVRVGAIEIRTMHTPGHTPGSQCFVVENRLVAGDTLFLDGCGRTDFPGGDSDEMYRSLHQRLATLPDDTVLYPGHLYSPEPSATLGTTRRKNYVFRMRSIEDWRRFQS